MWAQLLEKLSYCKGQSTVEAAFLIPVLLGVVLLMVQPGIVLYDRVVMRSAAAQACRLMVTLPQGDPDGQCKAFVQHRLAAVPQQDCFHVHADGCSWDIRCEGGEGSEKVSVSISTKIKPLPLVSFLSQAVGASGQDGCWTVKVEESIQTQPSWVASAAGGSDPSAWVGMWQK